MLITEAYRKEQHILHADGVYGTLGYNWAYLAAGIATVEGCNSILDYGCGKATIARALQRSPFASKVRSYDPGVPEFAAEPKPADLVVSVDVLEHIEPECLDEVLVHIRLLTLRLLFVAIATRPAKRFLTDGRNAHILIREDGWWRHQFERHGFRIRRQWLTGIREWVTLMAK